MKKVFKLFPVLLVALIVAACGGPNESGEKNVIRIGATPVPHMEILNEVKDDLAKEGVTLEIVSYTDYPLVNKALVEGEIDANFFQHIPYYEDFLANEPKGENTAILCGVHIEPMGIYSTKYKSLDELKDGDEVMIPNDTTNSGRPLLLLQNLGIIKLKDDAGVDATEKDIVENPKNLKFTRLDAAAIPAAYGDAAIAAINGNFALENGLNPLTDAIALEDKESPYVNIVVVKKDALDSEPIQKLKAALTSEKTKEFILDHYKGTVIPVENDK